MYTLVVEPRLSEAFLARIRDRRPDLEMVVPEDQSAVTDVVGDAEGPVAFLAVGSKWTDEYLAGLAEGDWVVTRTTGYDHYPIEEFRERGIEFSHIPGVVTDPVADHAFALVLSVSRRLRTYHDQQNEHVWRRQRDGMTDFTGDVCCVVGVGRCGEAVATRARAFGMTVRGVKRSVEGYEGPVDEIYPSGELRTALDGARVVVLCVPLTEETRGLIGKQELGACADDAVVVNVARGPVLDTEALVAALEDGQIRAAGIDVVDDRPPPDDWPLWDRDDVVVTPHVAGASDKAFDRYAQRFLEEFDRKTSGRDLQYRIV